MEKYSQLVLRVGLALVFFWFGFSQISNPNMWVSVLPNWVTSIPLSQIAFIYLNGWIEITFGFLLLIGFYTRFVALILALHLFGITQTVGYNAVGVRDFGLSMATLSIFFNGISPFSLDMFFTAKEKLNN